MTTGMEQFNLSYSAKNVMQEIEYKIRILQKTESIMGRMRGGKLFSNTHLNERNKKIKDNGFRSCKPPLKDERLLHFEKDVKKAEIYKQQITEEYERRCTKNSDS